MLCILYDVFDFIEVRQLEPAGSGAAAVHVLCMVHHSICHTQLLQHCPPPSPQHALRPPSPLCCAKLLLQAAAAAPGGSGRVLVHCSQGVSRSATLAIAYLMWKQAACYDDVFQAVKAARGVTNPNIGFICQVGGWVGGRNEGRLGAPSVVGSAVLYVAGAGERCPWVAGCLRLGV